MRPKPQCLGVPIIGVDHGLINLDTLEEVGPDVTGEIVVPGRSNVFRVTGNGRKPPRKAFVELGRQTLLPHAIWVYYDERRYFYLGRPVKRMINAAGFKVWPAELESLAVWPSRRAGSLRSFPHRTRGVAKNHQSGYSYWLLAASTETGSDYLGARPICPLQGPKTGGFCRRTGQISHRQGSLWRSLAGQEWV